jgi:hypothetical protein
MAAKKDGENAATGTTETKQEGAGKAPAETAKDQQTEGGGAQPDGAAPKGDGVETLTAELKSVDMRPTAGDMFANFMIAVAGRPMTVHQPASEIADTAARLTLEWMDRKAQFAGK